MATDGTGQSLPSRYRSQKQPRTSGDRSSSSDQPSSPGADAVARSKSRYRRKPDSSHGLPSDPTGPTFEPQQQQSAIPSRYRSEHSQPPLKPLYQEPLTRTSTLPQYVPPKVPPSKELFPPPRQETLPVRSDGPPQSGNIRATKSLTQLPTYDSDGEEGCFGGLFKRKRDVEPVVAAEKSPIARPQTAKGEVLTIKPGGGGIVPGTDAPISAINAGDRHVLIECGKSRTLFPVTPTTTPVDLIRSAATCMPERIETKSAVLLERFSTVGVQRPLRRYEHIRDVMNSWETDRQNSLLLVDPGTGTVEEELTLQGVPAEQPEEQTWPLLYSQKAGKWDKRFVTLRSAGQVVCQKDLDKPKDVTVICHLSDFDIYTPTPERTKKKIKPPKKYCFAIKSQQKTSLFESTHDFVHFFSTGSRADADSFNTAVQSWRSWYLVNAKGEGRTENTPQAAAPTARSGASRDRTTSNARSKSHRSQDSTDSHYQLGSFRPLIDMNQLERAAESSIAENNESGSSHGVIKSATQFDANVSPERRGSVAKKHPPLSLNSRAQLAEDEPLANLTRRVSTKHRKPSSDQKRPDGSEFAETGLLGRSYSQRRKEQSDRELHAEDAFTSGPSLLNGMAEPGHRSGEGLGRKPSSRRQGGGAGGDTRHFSADRESGRNRGGVHRGSNELDRTGSRQPSKPLVDLRPQFQEPPQHAKKGKGFHPDSIGEGGLIAKATSPDDPLGIPSQTIFRHASRSHQDPGGGPGPALSTLPPHHEPPPPAAAQAGHPAQRQVSPGGFTGEGLLAASQNRQGWGGNDRGRGVIDGSRAGGKPLLDLKADSQFVQGSLLNLVERDEGGPIPAPVIDRHKRLEKEEKYGEGY